MEGVYVRVWLRDGTTPSSKCAPNLGSWYSWEHHNTPGDIIAYQIVDKDEKWESN